ncbi:MAG: HAMP domain-containing histidine kinase, partial [Deltaproteobacteria bacterium]|nr:HAMP domain-containing histidine kinase [Deltaproteobacteria bacterium]
MIPWSGSLRYRVLWVLAVVALAPLVFVWLTDVADRTVGERMKVTVSMAAGRAERALQEDQDPGPRLDRVAWRYSVRVRVYDVEGVVLHDQDRESGSALFKRVADLVFQEDGAPVLRDFDAEQPPVSRRPQFAAALAEGHAVGCGTTSGRKLMVCHAARRVDLADGTVAVVFVEQSTRRAIRALYDVRYQLLKVTLLGLALAVVLGLWLGWRIVRPIESLRDQVLSRVDAPVTALPVAVDRVDEVGDLATAFNTLFGAVAERSQANEAFVADLAHEMKNPVAAIRAVAESLEGGEPPDEARAKRLARILADSSRRLDALVTQLLELARAEAGLPAEAREAVDLAAMVEAVAEAMRADERWSQTRVDVETSPGTVQGVPGRLETVFRNLLENAARYAGPEGHVKLAMVSSDAR